MKKILFLLLALTGIVFAQPVKTSATKMDVHDSVLIRDDTLAIHLDTLQSHNLRINAAIQRSIDSTSALNLRKLNIVDTTNKWQPKGYCLIPSDSTAFRVWSNILYQPKATYLIPSDSTAFRTYSNSIYASKVVKDSSNLVVPILPDTGFAAKAFYSNGSLLKPPVVKDSSNFIVPILPDYKYAANSLTLSNVNMIYPATDPLNSVLYGDIVYGNFSLGYTNFSHNITTSGQNNLAFGVGSLQYNTTGSNNIAIGYGAIGTENTSNEVIAIGDQTGGNNTVGQHHANDVLIGYKAGGALGTTAQTVAVGWAAASGGGVTYGTALGYYSLGASSSNGVISIGKYAGFYTGQYTLQNDNIFLGNYAGDTSGFNSSPYNTNRDIYIGYKTGLRSQGSYNVYLGDSINYFTEDSTLRIKLGATNILTSHNKLTTLLGKLKVDTLNTTVQIDTAYTKAKLVYSDTTHFRTYSNSIYSPIAGNVLHDSSGYLVTNTAGEGLKISYRKIHADSIQVYNLSRLSGVMFGETPRSSNYSITTNDHYIDCTGGSSGITVTLPTAVGYAGLTYTITKVDAAVGYITIATTSSQTINGATTYAISLQYVSITIHSNGSNWIIN